MFKITKSVMFAAVVSAIIPVQSKSAELQIRNKYWNGSGCRAPADPKQKHLRCCTQDMASLLGMLKEKTDFGRRCDGQLKQIATEAAGCMIKAEDGKTYLIKNGFHLECVAKPQEIRWYSKGITLPERIVETTPSPIEEVLGTTRVGETMPTICRTPAPEATPEQSNPNPTPGEGARAQGARSATPRAVADFTGKPGDINSPRMQQVIEALLAKHKVLARTDVRKDKGLNRDAADDRRAACAQELKMDLNWTDYKIGDSPLSNGELSTFMAEKFTVVVQMYRTQMFNTLKESKEQAKKFGIDLAFEGNCDAAPGPAPTGAAALREQLRIGSNKFHSCEALKTGQGTGTSNKIATKYAERQAYDWVNGPVLGALEKAEAAVAAESDPSKKQALETDKAALEAFASNLTRLAAGGFSADEAKFEKDNVHLYGLVDTRGESSANSLSPKQRLIICEGSYDFPRDSMTMGGPEVRLAEGMDLHNPPGTAGTPESDQYDKLRNMSPAELQKLLKK